MPFCVHYTYLPTINNTKYTARDYASGDYNEPFVRLYHTRSSYNTFPMLNEIVHRVDGMYLKHRIHIFY